jgi:DNA-binding transcriptional LysR family regulator
VDPRKLELLLELSRLGSMREVAEALDVTTSTVSQQIAALAREVGTPLLEPEGRRVRLTPAGRRLADHAVTVLAAIEAARADLDPDAEPAGEVRVASFATAIRTTVMPVVRTLARSHPDVRLRMHEHEPFEAMALLTADDVDLALTYDYNLAPVAADLTVDATPLWEAAWSLAVPTGRRPGGGDALAVFGRFRDNDWIVNSRNTADEDAVRIVASLAGFRPRVVHRVDSLELVQDLIAAGLGVALLPADQPTSRGVTLLPLTAPDVLLRAFAVTRRGRARWPPLALVLGMLTAGVAPYPPETGGGIGHSRGPKDGVA